jgi:hypothetical protein
MIFVMVKSCVFFAVRTELLNIIQTSLDFKGLITIATPGESRSRKLLVR